MPFVLYCISWQTARQEIGDLNIGEWWPYYTKAFLTLECYKKFVGINFQAYF